MDLQSGYPFSLIRYGLPFQYPKLTDNTIADVVIIGGGISGALAGYYLTEAGFDCVVVDGRTIGLGSTCASTSLLQYEIDVPLTELIRKIGLQPAVRAYELCRKAIYTLGALAKKLKVREFAFNRSLYYAASKKDRSFLMEEYQCRKRHGFAVEFLGDREIRNEFTFSAPAAILSHDGAYADAYLMTHALHQHGLTKNLRVYDRTYIKRVTPITGGIKAITSEGISIRAKKLIYATGYEVTEKITKKIVNLYSTYVTITESLMEAHPIMKNGTMMWSTADPYLYLRNTLDKRIIIGGRDEKFSNPLRRDKLIRQKSKSLIRDYHKLFPQIPVRPEFNWTGTFGSTEDGLPFIGTHPRFPHSYFALGFGGNGITFSVIAAEIIRDLMTGRKNADAKIFSFDRIR